VVGDGVIGLAIAMHLAVRKNTVVLVSPELSGAASPASAGMLAPSVERTQGPAQAFGDASRDAWPRLAALTRQTGAGEFEIRRDGILRIARSEVDADVLRATLRPGDQWFNPAEAHERAPTLGKVEGAALYAGDGVVDAPAAMSALRSTIAAMPDRVSVVRARATALITSRLEVQLDDGETVAGDAVVLAAGAWTPQLVGLPRPLPVRPLRGVMFAAEARLVDVPVYDSEGHVYLLPRGARTIVGATSEDAGFDTAAPEASAASLLAAAISVVPDLRDCRMSRPWAGLRPMTPDGLPILGEDPAVPGLFYACGHGRNGFLEAALTGEVIAALIAGEDPQADLQPFKVSRFS
jgi:glycine oxidase